MPHILATAVGFPPHYYSQESVTRELQEYWAESGVRSDRLEGLHRATTVEGRYFAAPKEAYRGIRGWETPNAVFAEAAVELGCRLIDDLTEGSGIGTEDIDLLLFASTTGLSIPTVDARIMNRRPFRADVRRLPVYGLGCVAGAAGVARVADFLRGHPDKAAVLLCLEFCSLTIQKHDASIANQIACGLFGDGGGAVLLTGDEHPRVATGHPAVLNSRSVFFRDAEDYMGWRVREAGMELVLSAEVPRAVERELRAPVVALLAEHELGLDDVSHWICHPGGPRVIDAVEQALGINGRALAPSRDVLRRVGNVSSVSVLIVLDHFLREAQTPPGSYGMMMAMGPGFSAELVLLQW